MTTDHATPPTIEEYGRALEAKGKLFQCWGLILQMPESGLPEMIETLVGLSDFYRQPEPAPAPEPGDEGHEEGK